jgi:hypothetical protein
MFAFLLFTFVPGCKSSGGSQDDLYGLAVKISSCAVGPEYDGLGLYIDSLLMLDRRIEKDNSTEYVTVGMSRECVEQAKNCDELYACDDVDPADAAVCEGALPDSSQCSGDVIVVCRDYPTEEPFGYDCSTVGMICGQNEYDADCALGVCDSSQDRPYCDGDLLVECDDDKQVLVSHSCYYRSSIECVTTNGGQNCNRQIGGTCTSELGVECGGTGPDCDKYTFRAYCDGPYIVTCRYSNGKESRFDCRDTHPAWTCRLDADNEPDCVPDKEECLIVTDETCDDGVVTTCVGGEITELNCKKYGYSGCATMVNDVDRTVAYCTP